MQGSPSLSKATKAPTPPAPADLHPKRCGNWRENGTSPDEQGRAWGRQGVGWGPGGGGGAGAAPLCRTWAATRWVVRVTTWLPVVWLASDVEDLAPRLPQALAHSLSWSEDQHLAYRQWYQHLGPQGAVVDAGGQGVGVTVAQVDEPGGAPARVRPEQRPQRARRRQPRRPHGRVGWGGAGWGPAVAWRGAGWALLPVGCSVEPRRSSSGAARVSARASNPTAAPSSRHRADALARARSRPTRACELLPKELVGGATVSKRQRKAP